MIHMAMHMTMWHTINIMGSLAVLFTLILPAVCLLSAADRIRDRFAMHAAAAGLQLPSPAATRSAAAFMTTAAVTLILFGCFVVGLTLTEVLMSQFAHHTHERSWSAPLCPIT